MERKIFLILGFFALGNASLTNLNNNLSNKLILRNSAIDYNLHYEVLDTEKCDDQLSVLRSNPLLLWQFTDAGLRLPKGMLGGNLRDMGNYHQCLGINHNTGDDFIQGKYCRIIVPFDQRLSLPFQSYSTLFGFNEFDEFIRVDNETITKAEEFKLRRAGIMTRLGLHDERTLKTAVVDSVGWISLDLAICVPRVCTTEQAINSFLFGSSSIEFTHHYIYCRLPEDKPSVPADTVAIVILSIIAVLTILSTCYDIVKTFWLKTDPKNVHPLLTSFSVYTNGRRLNSFSSAPGMLRCIDGIRALSMAWVVVAHSFSTEFIISNPIDANTWLDSTSSAWIGAAVYAVDTFFCLAGTRGVFTYGQLLKRLPLFYLNRLLRLWPLLAFAILLQVSYLNRVFDGPEWAGVENQTNDCRTTWWLTLLFVQNYINANWTCMPHSWYMAIDFQCYVVSPLVLYWVLGRSRKSAWIALTASLLAILAASATYIFIRGFPASLMSYDPRETNYFKNYYTNTLTRASPFFVGMIVGYILHLYRGKKLDISWVTAVSLWVISAVITTPVFFYSVIVLDYEWDQPVLDSLMNSFMRPAWGAAIGWMIVACEHGYGGPVNWFLTLDIWRLPARLAYGVYVLHYPMMYVINASLAVAPLYFTVPTITFKALSYIALFLVLGYLATLIIDAPCSTLSKLLLEGNKKKYTQAMAPKNEEAQSAVKDTDNISNKNNSDNDKKYKLTKF